MKNKGLLICCLLTGCIVMLSACHNKLPSKPIVKPEVGVKLTKSGVDYNSVLGCIGSIKSEIVNQTQDRQRRVTGYTVIVTCVNSGRSYKLNYSEMKYSGRRRTSYKEEMVSTEPKEHHIVYYTDIKYSETGEVIGYTTNLNGRTYKE